MKKKGKRLPDFFSEAIKAEIEEIISLPYNQKSNYLMNKLIRHLNVGKIQAVEGVFEL